MPRNAEEVRRRLQRAALDLYQDRGYEQTTAAEIAARAGVTERTFFRHFPDKREVLFAGETLLGDALTRAVADAPAALGPWAALFRAFRSLEQLFAANRAFSEPRRRIIAGSPALQERELAKVRSLTGTLAAALGARGVPGPLASLAAQLGMAALGQAVGAWLEGDAGDLDRHLVQSFRDVRDLAADASEAGAWEPGIP
jgi:AcrR family transcriptional regulator